MISAILLLCQMLMITSVTINLSEQCTCEHYSQEMCNLYSFCSWNNDKCGNIVCANKPKDMCTASYTDFKCEYDSVENVCKEKKYTCNDLGENYCQFSKILGMNCIWSINNKCEDFDCTIAKNCPFKYCAYSNKQCSNPTTKTDCTALTYSQCQLSSDGYGNFCLLNEYNVCKSYDAQIECSQWNDQPLLSCLSIGCQIDDFKCRDKKCSDFYSQKSCTYIYEDDTNSITVCKWTGRYCVEATSQDIESFTKYDCVLNSVLTYEWENEKCQKCVNPVSSNTNNNQPTSSSTESNSSSTSSSSTTNSSTSSSTTNESSTSSSTTNSSNTSSSTTNESNTSSSTTNSSNTSSSTSNTQPSTNENTNQTPTNNQTSNNQQNQQSSTNETPTESSSQGETNNQTPITNETEPNSNQETPNQINQENSNQNNTLNTNSTIPDNQNTTQTNNTSSSQNPSTTQNQTVTTVINQVQNNDTNSNQTFTNLTSKIKAQIKANDMLEIQVLMFEHLLWITIAFIYLS